jgi:glycosyltransferase involved in cell wall biosynthesis
VDDLVFSPCASVSRAPRPRGGAWIRRLLRWEAEAYRRGILRADAVLASTETLARQAAVMGRPARVVRNAFSLEMLIRSRAVAPGRRTGRPDRVVLGYASGTRTHDRDVERIAAPLRRVLDRHPNVDLWLVGPVRPGPALRALGSRIRRLPRVPWRELPPLLARFDVNLAPLVLSDPFCRAKSEIKYVEAALVRVPTVASPTEAYRRAIRPGENGLLAETERDWEEAVAGLVEDPDRRRRLGDRAFEDALARYHPAVRARELAEALDDLARLGRRPATLREPRPGRADPGRDDGAASPEAEAAGAPSLLRRAAYALRYRGPRVFCLQALACLRERYSRMALRD